MNAKPKKQTAARFKVQGSRSKVQGSLFGLGVLCLGLLLAGCTGPRPLRGGQALTTRRPGGTVEQVLVQGENPAQASRQEQHTTRVRTYTVPARSAQGKGTEGGGRRGRLDYETTGLQDYRAEGGAGDWTTRPRDYRTARPEKAEGGIPVSQLSPLNSQPLAYQPSASPDSQLSTLNYPLLLTEREETHTRTELGAAQKDMARELGARLASLKGIVWVGVGLFVFGLASLVWPPLKLVMASVTTSAGCMLGGVALMVLPNLIAGHELLLLGIVGLAVGAWFLAHRHGQLRGEVSSLKAKV